MTQNAPGPESAIDPTDWPPANAEVSDPPDAIAATAPATAKEHRMATSATSSDEITESVLARLDLRFERLNDRMDQLAFAIADGEQASEGQQLFQTSVAESLARLSAAIEGLVPSTRAAQAAPHHMSPGNSSDQRPPGRPLPQEPADPRYEPRRPADPVEPQLRRLAMEVRHVSDRMLGLEARMSDAPDPGVAIQSAFAQGTEDLGARQSAALSELRADIAARLADLQTQIADQRSYSPGHDDLSTLLSERHAELVDTVTARMDKLAARPDPVVDLTAQRQSLTQFTAAMGTAIARLESATDALTSDDSASDDESEVDRRLTALAETCASIDARLSEMNDSLRSNLSAATEDMAGRLTALTGDLASLPDTLDLLARRPDPVIDMTMQHRSFAAFSAASGAFLRRLECLVASMAADHVQLSRLLHDRLSNPGGDGPALDGLPDALATAMNTLAETNRALISASVSATDSGSAKS